MLTYADGTWPYAIRLLQGGGGAGGAEVSIHEHTYADVC
jgi:hypothetical protein